MTKQTTFGLIIALCMLAACTTVAAQQEIDPQLVEQAEDDIAVMRTMTPEQRRAYQEEQRANRTPEQQRAYQRAFKLARERAQAAPSVTRRGGSAYTPLETPRSVETNAAIRAPGTSIQYDSGTVTGTAGVASQMLGNRFDTARNGGGVCCTPVEMSGSI
ncbi:MAG: hypothetical protein V2J55_16940, partial [Candidatus Competibacteraceae bacterium]|nr:hypothetical protein [Candidatus Competibacteraceae bacterium]